MKEISETRNIVQNSSFIKILKGIIISCIITFVLLFIFATVLTYTNVGENTIVPVIIAITGVSILARKFYDNKLYKEKWTFQWRSNRIYLYSTDILAIKFAREWIYIKYVFNNNDSNWNCSRSNRGNSTE